MKAMVWFRVSAIILLLFALGHTVGFLSFHGSTAAAQAVREQMDAVHFAAKPGRPATLSFGGFYMGFGLFITVFYLFSAWVAWRLGAMAKRGSPDVAALGWAMVAMMVVSSGLTLRYFSVQPMVLSVVLAACLAVATWLARPRFS
jgi:tetrahydromethanopterin S-methyltransferase subunit E